MKNISQKEWRALIKDDDNAVIIDSRTPAECQVGIIEDAIMIDVMSLQTFQNFANTLDISKNYYIYCRSGVRSMRACQILESIGVKTTYNLSGGILEWDYKIVIPKI
jgi:rhodanese-related sulfurtransferase